MSFLVGELDETMRYRRKEKIVTWEKMKRKKFDSLMIKGDLRKVEEQSITWYLGGMKYEIFDVVTLQPFWSLMDVMKLALKVER